MSEAIFFDLDGTLTDPFIGITRSMQYALESLRVPVPDATGLKWCIGPPMQDSFVTLVGKRRAEQALSLYRERYSEVGWAENDVYPGIPGVLEALVGAGWILYVATSKPQVFADRIIDHFGLRPFFTRVYGAELDGTRAAKPDLLKYALIDARIDGVSTMIGDRKHDIAGALNNDMHAIGVTYGYGSVAELQAAGAHWLARKPEDILSLMF